MREQVETIWILLNTSPTYYWTEFLRTKEYEEYWDNWDFWEAFLKTNVYKRDYEEFKRSEKRSRCWEYHLDKIDQLFKMFLIRKREGELK